MGSGSVPSTHSVVTGSKTGTDRPGAATLRSKHFTSPPDRRLEACLVNDAAHITPGTIGDHVKRIQIALNLLSAGPGRKTVFLKVDGIYGPRTAAAVKAYKQQRRILQPWQTSPDDIVGKRTLKSLDEEMEVLENEEPADSGFVATTPAGARHDHSKCPGPPRVSGSLYLGLADHLGTPINPKAMGRMINIYGEGETDYLGFVDFATEVGYSRGRPLTSSLPDDCASDICMRSAPISQVTEKEIKRLARPSARGGCRFTYASNIETFTPPKPKLLSFGIVIAQGRLAVTGYQNDTSMDTEVWVIELRK